MRECKKCNERRFNAAQECRCKTFTIIDEDGGQHEVRSTDKKSAALKYAEQSNTENDHYLMNESVVIAVNGTKFGIGAEPSVYYSVKEIQP